MVKYYLKVKINIILMSYNIILNNFSENDFVSKGAKSNIKKFIKKNVPSINEINK